MLILLSPILFFSIILVKFSSKGPAIYFSKRAGRNSKPFSNYKIRTMYFTKEVNTEIITNPNDKRVTKIGKFLRKFKIDEIPQFWNVLKGEMSIVGPRPESVEIVTKYYSSEQLRTLSVRPGITSRAMIKWYPDLTYHDPNSDVTNMTNYYLNKHLKVKLEEELKYIENNNFINDFHIIIQTVYCVLIQSWILPKKKKLP